MGEILHHICLKNHEIQISVKDDKHNKENHTNNFFLTTTEHLVVERSKEALYHYKLQSLGCNQAKERSFIVLFMETPIAMFLKPDKEANQPHIWVMGWSVQLDNPFQLDRMTSHIYI